MIMIKCLQSRIWGTEDMKWHVWQEFEADTLEDTVLARSMLMSWMQFEDISWTLWFLMDFKGKCLIDHLFHTFFSAYLCWLNLRVQAPQTSSDPCILHFSKLLFASVNPLIMHVAMFAFIFCLLGASRAEIKIKKVKGLEFNGLGNWKQMAGFWNQFVIHLL